MPVPECHKRCNETRAVIWRGSSRASSRGKFQVQAATQEYGRPLHIGVKSVVMESREVMNVRQASQYLGISPDTLYRYITEGEIPAFKLGNRWKLRKTILDRWMERKMSQAHVRRR